MLYFGINNMYLTIECNYHHNIHMQVYRVKKNEKTNKYIMYTYFKNSNYTLNITFINSHYILNFKLKFFN